MLTDQIFVLRQEACVSSTNRERGKHICPLGRACLQFIGTKPLFSPLPVPQPVQEAPVPPAKRYEH